MVGLGSLHVAEAGRRFAGVDGQTIDHKGGGRLAGSQRAAIAVKEGIDGIDAIDGRVPQLGALLLQQPAAHLIDGLLVGRCHTLDSLDSGYLGRYLVVVPRVAGATSIVVASHLLSIDGIFLQTLHILCSLGLLTMLGENDGGECLLIDGLALDVFLQQTDEVVVGGLYVRLQCASVNGADVEPAQGGECREALAVALLLLLFHLLHHVHHFLADEFEGVVVKR